MSKWKIIINNYIFIYIKYHTFQSESLWLINCCLISSSIISIFYTQDGNKFMNYNIKINRLKVVHVLKWAYVFAATRKRRDNGEYIVYIQYMYICMSKICLTTGNHYQPLKQTFYQDLQSSKWQLEFTGPSQILELILYIYIYLNKNWKIYWFEQSFTCLGQEDRCSSRVLELL